MFSRPAKNASSDRIAKLNAVAAHDRCWSSIIIENLTYMEKQCRKAVARYSQELRWGDDASLCHWDARAENEADELLNELLDRLSLGNFRALREYRGAAKITTYLTTIISNLIVDIIRSKKGRSRAKERARELGPTGERLYELVFGRGYSLPEAHEQMKIAYSIEESMDNLRAMLDRIGGREFLPEAADGAFPNVGVEIGDDGDFEQVVVDSARNAEEEIIFRQRKMAAQEALAQVLEGMSGEERVMIRMRFPADDQSPPGKIADIARSLKLNEKVVDSRIRRVLARCREMLLGRGVRLDDLIEL